MNARPYQSPSANIFGTSETLSDITMFGAMRKFPETARNRAAELSQLSESDHR